MAIPVADTTVDVYRSRTEDGYDEPVPVLVFGNVRAVINEPIAAARMPSLERPAGTLHKSSRTIVCDRIDLQVNDHVVDRVTGREYRVVIADYGPNIIPFTTGELADIGYKPR